MTRKGPRPQLRLSWAPLERAVIPDGGDPEHQDYNPQQATLYSVRYVARRLHTTPTQVYRYRRDGIPLHSADRLCIHINRHPADLWPDEYPKEEHHEDEGMARS